MITKYSINAERFPTLDVEYEDLLMLNYREDARYGSGSIACLGVVLEVFKRAGLGLPDPRASGRAAFRFSELFEPAEAPDTLFDVISSNRKQHVAVVVRTGLAISAESCAGVIVRPTKIFTKLPNVKYWRVRTDSLP